MNIFQIKTDFDDLFEHVPIANLEQDSDELDSVAHGGPCAYLLEVPPEERLGLGEENALHKTQHERQQDLPVAKKPA